MIVLEGRRRRGRQDEYGLEWEAFKQVDVLRDTCLVKE